VNAVIKFILIVFAMAFGLFLMEPAAEFPFRVIGSAIIYACGYWACVSGEEK